MDAQDDAAELEVSSHTQGGSQESHLKFKEDTLSEALSRLFLNVAKVAQGEFQETSNVLQLLEMMNNRTTIEYNNEGDFASGLRVFVEKLKQKNDAFSTYLKEIDEIDREVTELEAVVSTLDNYTNTLEAKLRATFWDRTFS
ncbi:hypothetical protein O6H91_01G119400 [Diphasiastrum complanatum]|uniref:Uncharacterized protein n=2 Tax=Diphasiastrum complanatum TaxID=34168 RepID=A0ACC2EV47_DIPCM|nr:hypothetical protein O6H91_01G119400 [Diphasiastrum complanatum]